MRSRMRLEFSLFCDILTSHYLNSKFQWQKELFSQFRARNLSVARLGWFPLILPGGGLIFGGCVGENSFNTTNPSQYYGIYRIQCHNIASHYLNCRFPTKFSYFHCLESSNCRKSNKGPILQCPPLILRRSTQCNNKYTTTPKEFGWFNLIFWRRIS